ncbi:anti-repressor Ant [Bacillus phage Staley]|uniref:Antirepressor/regulatory protein n=1 Tax=Bacillus phage Staley TaxID=1406792 RepID=U5PYB2_9CAUD|nr:anti-repressor Ant [Bacillus phage Staley]AGY48786.1 antirepressor/regulatory protein [Bacillus phage Staley]
MKSDLVYVTGENVVTDSLVICNVFGKRHADVLRDIDVQMDKLEAAGEQEFSQRNFALSNYEMRGKSYRKYLLTEDGFALIVMSYVTPAAMSMKVAFLAEFKKMKEYIQNNLKQPSYMIADPIARAEKWIEEQKEKQMLEQIVTEQKPKVESYDRYIDIEDTHCIRDVGKILGYGQKEFFNLLKDNGILYKNRNIPIQKYIDSGFFVLKTGPAVHAEKTFTQARITNKGLDWLSKKFSKAS